METDDLLRLLSSRDGIELLRNGCNDIGISVDKSCIDFGTKCIEELSCEQIIPYGYDEFEDSPSPRKATTSINIHIGSSFERVIFKSFRILPQPPQVQIKLRLDENEDFRGDVVLHDNPQQAPHSVQVVLLVPESYSGFFGCWIFLTFEAFERKSFTTTVIYRSTMCVRVTGCIVPPGMNSLLSSNAKPFIPLSMLNYFDGPCFIQSLYKSVKMRVPFRYELLMNSIGDKYHVLEDVKQTYSLGKSSKCDVIIQRYGLNFDSDIKHLSEMSIVNTALCTKYLNSLGMMQWMEELQMLDDIRQYDCHYMSITFTKDSFLRFATLTVRGSSENRPAIAIGDKVRIRPDLHDLQRKNRRLFNHIGIFEMVGQIENFVLAKEEVNCLNLFSDFLNFFF